MGLFLKIQKRSNSEGEFLGEKKKAENLKERPLPRIISSRNHVLGSDKREINVSLFGSATASPVTP